jgi:maltooligosyltrehalose synthase
MSNKYHALAATIELQEQQRQQELEHLWERLTGELETRESEQHTREQQYLTRIQQLEDEVQKLQRVLAAPRVPAAPTATPQGPKEGPQAALQEASEFSTHRPYHRAASDNHIEKQHPVPTAPYRAPRQQQPAQKRALYADIAALLATKPWG